MGLRVCPWIAKGAKLLLLRPQIFAPIVCRGLMTRDMGRDRKEASPVTQKRRSG